MELDKSDIQTTITENTNILQTVQGGGTTVVTQIADVPQIQTILQDNIATIATIINAPFVEVTSVNGRTGDVVVEPIIKSFEANFPYPKDAVVSYDGAVYVAKEAFTSGGIFDADDWNRIEAATTADWDDIIGKPNFAQVATSGSYVDLLNKPVIDDALSTSSTNAVQNSTTTAALNLKANTADLSNVAFTGMYEDIIGTPSLSSVALSGVYSDLIGRPSLATVATSGRAADLIDLPISTSLIGDLAITTAKLADSAVTTAKIKDGTVTSEKLDKLDLARSGEWVLIDNSTTTASITGSACEVYIPEGCQGYGWEYKLEISAEFINPTGYPWLQAQVAGTWVTQQCDFGYMKLENGNHSTYRGGSVNPCSLEWHVVNAYDGFAGEVFCSRPGSGNWWNFTSNAGGISTGVASAFHGGARLSTSSSLTGFRLSLSTVTALEGTHISLFARKYAE